MGKPQVILGALEKVKAIYDGARKMAPESWEELFLRVMDPQKLPDYLKAREKARGSKHWDQYTFAKENIESSPPVNSWEDMLDPRQSHFAGRLSDYTRENTFMPGRVLRVARGDGSASAQTQRGYAHYSMGDPTQLVDIYGNMLMNPTRLPGPQTPAQLFEYAPQPPKVRVTSDNRINNMREGRILAHPAWAYPNRIEGKYNKTKVPAGEVTFQEVNQPGVSLLLAQGPLTQLRDTWRSRAQQEIMSMRSALESGPGVDGRYYPEAWKGTGVSNPKTLLDEIENISQMMKKLGPS